MAKANGIHSIAMIGATASRRPMGLFKACAPWMKGINKEFILPYKDKDESSLVPGGVDKVCGCQPGRVGFIGFALRTCLFRWLI